MEDKSSPEYREAAARLIKSSRTVQGLADEYVKDKDLYAITGAGGQRLNGALYIRREAKLIEASLQKQVSMIDRYAEQELVLTLKSALSVPFPVQPERTEDRRAKKPA